MARPQPSKPRPLTEAEIARILREKTAAKRQSRHSEIEAIKDVVLGATIYEFPGRAIAATPIISAATEERVFEPVQLIKLLQEEESLVRLFRGLEHHYLPAIAAGRLDAWKACAHGVIELMCATAPDIHKRIPTDTGSVT